MQKYSLITFMTLALICLMLPVRANFAGTYGFSAEGLSRGNAMSASVNDWTSVYYNIAGLGNTSDRRVKDTPVKKNNGKSGLASLKAKTETTGAEEIAEYNDEFGLNYIYGIPLMKFNHPVVKLDGQLDSGYIGLGLVLDLNHFYEMPKFISSARFGMGLGTNMYYDRSNKKLVTDLAMAEDGNPEFYHWADYGKSSQGALILAGLGLGFIDDMFGVGLGVSAWMGGSGYMEMNNVKLSATPQTPSSNARLDVGGTIAPNVGLYYRPFKWLNVGANYIGELFMEIDPLIADATIVTQSGGALAQMKMAVTIMDFYTPHIFKVGIASVNLFDRVTVNIDAEYQMWSHYTPSRAKREYYKNLGISIPKLRDAIVPRCGVEVKALDWLYVRTGYSYEMSVLTPEMKKSIFNIMDNDKHIATFGLGFIIPKMGPMISPIEINLGFGYQYLVKQSVVKDDKTHQIFAGYTGQPYISNSDYSYSGHAIIASIESVMRW